MTRPIIVLTNNIYEIAQNALKNSKKLSSLVLKKLSAIVTAKYSKLPITRNHKNSLSMLL